MNHRVRKASGGLAFATLFVVSAVRGLEPVPGESPALGTPRIAQEDIEQHRLPLIEIRREGLRVFSTSFNKLDGYGDGPMNPFDTVSPGGRPTLQGNGTFLRVNGLDAQSCLECHAIVSNATVPPRLGIGGVGGFNSNAMIRPTAIDPADLLDFDSAAGFNGRVANPPFLFGAGGVELLAVEMTEDLRALRRAALANPGTAVPLVTKGVRFGILVADALGNLDTSGVEGVDEDLVVRPFGRKGELFTTRDFDRGAMQFHFGMQPVEVVAEEDADGDGVFDEVTVGEMSALQIFTVTLEPPFMQSTSSSSFGLAVFRRLGCDGCHMRELRTRGRELPVRLEADPSDPGANVYRRINLSGAPARIEPPGHGGIRVRLFADLKRHDMGEALAESLTGAGERNRQFTTARLWGVADTAPYLHDGRATTLTEAVLLHGGEAQPARDRFETSPPADREALLAFLRSLRTPEHPAQDLLEPGSRGGPGSR